MATSRLGIVTSVFIILFISSSLASIITYLYAVNNIDNFKLFSDLKKNTVIKIFILFFIGSSISTLFWSMVTFVGWIYYINKNSSFDRSSPIRTDFLED